MPAHETGCGLCYKGGTPFGLENPNLVSWAIAALGPEGDISFIILNGKQTCPLLSKETPSLSSKAVC